MAQSLYDVEAIIKKSYSLQVAVRCTTSADALCMKNQLTFCELVEPFCHLSSPVQSKDLQGHPYTLKNVCIRFSDPQLEPTPPTKLQTILSDAVKNGMLEGKQPLVRYGSVTTNASTPWYDGYRNIFLEKRRQEDREPIRHYVSVLLVVCSTEPDVMEAFAGLYTKQKEAEQSKNSKWLTPHMFYYHILLHDVLQGNSARAEDNLAKIQATYGSGSCVLLHINSRRPDSVVLGDNPWSHVASQYTAVNSTREDETDGLSNFKFSIGKRKKKKSAKILKESPPTNHSSPLVTSSPISPSPSDVPSSPPPPLLPTTSISPPPSTSSSTSLSALPTDTHPLSEDTPSNHEIITPNVREEATLEQSSSEDDSLSETNEHSSSPLLSSVQKGGNKVAGVRGKAVGNHLSAEDETIVRNFVSEFVGQKLIPHLEAVLKNLNEWLISRRSMRRSISFMSKRFLGMLGGQLNSTQSDEPSYPSNSQEFQMRQFADLSFLLQSYDQAFLNYSAVKKDFHSSSPMHYAKALEMCAITAYMLSSTRREIIPFFEEAISMFTLSCKAPVSALRCSILLCEVLKERGLYRELTQIFIKMTSEESDLHSAVCLEQAAHAFLRIHPPMARKYALHLILAGHRYSKSGQRVHSARVYTQALEVYRGKGWALAEDYVHFSLARHCYSLQRLRDARLAFEHLLDHDSVQSAPQQLLNLREYIYVHKLLLNDTDYCSGQQVKFGEGMTSATSADRVQSVPLLPIPFVNASLTRVVFQTGIGLQQLQTLLTRYDSALEEERESDETVRPLGKERMKSLLQQLTDGGSGSHQPKPLIIGSRDFNPSQMKGSMDEWRELEEIAAGGPQGTPRENFMPSGVMMNQNTDNSNVPLCVVNECVSVGIVMRNPLKVSLVMKRVALTWSHSPLPSGTGGGEGARVEVIEKVVVQPLSEKMVMLKITPLCEGELDVLGFIYHLCVEQTAQVKGSESPQPSSSKTSLPSLNISSRDTLYQRHQHSLAEGVQGRVEFSVQGPRLNRTKEHKRGVVYGPDHRLHWKVTTPMPRALVCLSDVPGEVLNGEVCRVTVEVVNCGQVPLNSLRLTSSAGGQLLLDPSVTSSESVYPSSVAPPTPTSPPPSLLSLRHQPPPCIELPLPSGRLEPGVGVSMGVVLQTIDPLDKVEVPWNLLLYYEPTLITSNSRMTHRVLQYSHILSVRESLVLKTSATPTQSPTTTHTDRFDLNQLLVTLEAENKCQHAVEMRITQVSCLSHRWTIQRMDDLQGVVSLSPNEAGIIPLKASYHSLSPSPSSTSTDSLRFSDVPFGPTTIPSTEFPALNLLCASEGYGELVGRGEGEEVGVGWGDREKWRGRGERAEEHSDILLVVFWQALVSQGTDVLYSYGHHTTPVRLPQSMTLLKEPSPSSLSPSHSPYDLVKHYLEHPASLAHNFSTMAYCQVPVVITLQNCCHCNVQVVLELLHPKEISQDTKASSKQLVPESSVIWTGATCQRHISLEANSLQTVRVFANFAKAGVYNLQNIKVGARLEGHIDYHIQRWQRTSLISVVDCQM